MARKIDHTVVKLRGHNVRHLAMSPDGDWAYVPHCRSAGRPATKENIDRGWIVGNRLSRVPLKEEGPREAISLDPRRQRRSEMWTAWRSARTVRPWR